MVIRKFVLMIMFTIISSVVYADDQSDVSQGAHGYDWQACVDTKKSECENACTTSEDVDCKDNCDTMANDKCVSEGLNPPEQ